MIEQIKRQLFDEGHHIMVYPDDETWHWDATWWLAGGGQGHSRGTAGTYWKARRIALDKVAHIKRWQWRAAA